MLREFKFAILAGVLPSKLDVTSSKKGESIGPSLSASLLNNTQLHTLVDSEIRRISSQGRSNLSDSS